MKSLPIKDVVGEVRRLGRGSLFFEGHAKNAMLDGGVYFPDVQYVLFVSGKHNANTNRTRFCPDRKEWTYAIEGPDPQGRKLRIVVWFKKSPPLPNRMVAVLTVVEDIK